MNNKDDRGVLGCHLVQDLAYPRPESVRGHFCSQCHQEVWVMPKNLIYGLEIVCFRCVALEIVKCQDEGEEVRLLPASLLSERN